ncbi:MAG TPA: secondary thiamine-phosphate synthase enzyme YjbQ [Phycisphaerae bacterium]|nr:secondary thiamine-phosphate synthase enzyme YjbQ [Phycisphaerae bacterium]
MLKTLDVPSSKRCEFIDVTSEVQSLVAEAGVSSGCVVCYVPHTTAGITIQENADPDVTADLARRLEALAPHGLAEYRHSEGNSDAHIKSSLLGASACVLIDGGRLVLGTWQAIYFAEFDGPRRRKLHVKVVAD